MTDLDYRNAYSRYLLDGLESFAFCAGSFMSILNSPDPDINWSTMLDSTIGPIPTVIRLPIFDANIMLISCRKGWLTAAG